MKVRSGSVTRFCCRSNVARPNRTTILSSLPGRPTRVRKLPSPVCSVRHGASSASRVSNQYPPAQSGRHSFCLKILRMFKVRICGPRGTRTPDLLDVARPSLAAHLWFAVRTFALWTGVEPVIFRMSLVPRSLFTDVQSENQNAAPRGIVTSSYLSP